MADAVHHVQVVTRDREVLVRYLEDTLEMKRFADIRMPRTTVDDLLHCTPTDGWVCSTLLGSGPSGLVEVIECPEALDHPAYTEPMVGTLGIAFDVPDVARCVEAAHGLGAQHIVGPKTLSLGSGEIRVACFELAGTQIQLSQSKRAARPHQDRPHAKDRCNRTEPHPSKGAS